MCRGILKGNAFKMIVRAEHRQSRLTTSICYMWGHYRGKRGLRVDICMCSQQAAIEGDSKSRLQVRVNSYIPCYSVGLRHIPYGPDTSGTRIRIWQGL